MILRTVLVILQPLFLSALSAYFQNRDENSFKDRPVRKPVWELLKLRFF